MDGVPLPGVQKVTFDFTTKKGIIILDSWVTWMSESSALVKAFEKLDLDVSFAPSAFKKAELT